MPDLQGMLDIISCYKVFPIIATGRWLSPGTLSASNNKTDCHNITFYPALVLFEQANCIDWINVCYTWSLTKYSFSGTWFLLSNRKKRQPYKRWRHIWCIWKRLERRLFQLFSDNLAVVLDFLILQDKQNIRTLSLNIKLICTRCEIVLKSSSKARFSTCF
jgi:hypothetical protein